MLLPLFPAFPSWRTGRTNVTTMDEMDGWLGKPLSLFSLFGDAFAEWLYAGEIKGVVEYDGVSCDFHAGDAVT